MSPETHLLALACDSGRTALIIRLIIQTILLDPSGAVWTDGPSNVSSPDPSGAVQIDAEHPSRNRKVEGSSPSLGLHNHRSGHFWHRLLRSGNKIVIRLVGSSRRRRARPVRYEVFPHIVCG